MYKKFVLLSALIMCSTQSQAQSFDSLFNPGTTSGTSNYGGSMGMGSSNNTYSNQQAPAGTVIPGQAYEGCPATDPYYDAKEDSCVKECEHGIIKGTFECKKKKKDKLGDILGKVVGALN